MGLRPVEAMDHSSQPFHHQHRQPMRVVKPTIRIQQHQHAGQHQNESFERHQGGPRTRPFAPVVVARDVDSLAPMPAVKILAKSSKPQVLNSTTQVNATTALAHHQQQQHPVIAKPPTIMANRQSVAGIAVRPSDVTSGRPSATGASVPQGKPSISNSVSILEKQLARMNIVPSADHRERELAYNCTKLLDGEFNFQDTATLERCLLADQQTAVVPTSTASNGQSFCIVGAIGLDGVGKSSLLNSIANRSVFKTHRSFAEDRLKLAPATTVPKSNAGQLENPLTHVTSGIDLHITSERLFLLDTQPLLSASILDEFLRNSNNGAPMYSHHHHHHQQHMSNGNGGFSLSSIVGFDITEPENFAYIYSMQLLTFMFSICDHLVLVLDSYSLDVYLLKLVASALMLVGDSVQKANLIIYLKPLKTQTAAGPAKAATGSMMSRASTSAKAKERFGSLPSAPSPHRSATHNQMHALLKSTITLMLGPNVNLDFITDESRLLATVLKPPSRHLLLTESQSRPIQYTTERAWFHSVQRFWDSSIRKSTLFSDYARHLP